MNETYWVVVEPAGNWAYWTLQEKRTDAIQKYYTDFMGATTSKQERRLWKVSYHNGARCIKVRLVPVGDE